MIGAPEAEPLSAAARFLVQALASLDGPGLVTVAISGPPGAGKTTLADKLARHFGAQAARVSEDDFLAVSTDQRKAYLQEALTSGDRDRLAALAAPADPALNPYANPVSWYDWPALLDSLAALKAGRSCRRDAAWDQQTGRCDRSVLLTPPSLRPGFILFDTNYPLEGAGSWDLLVFLSISPDRAQARQQARDGHRSGAAYLAYKDKVDDLYTRPYQNRVRARADIILNNF